MDPDPYPYFDELELTGQLRLAALEAKFHGLPERYLDAIQRAADLLDPDPGWEDDDASASENPKECDGGS